jgi:hypothetical protein
MRRYPPNRKVEERRRPGLPPLPIRLGASDWVLPIGSDDSPQGYLAALQKRHSPILKFAAQAS